MEIQQPLFAPPTTWQPPRISDLPSWSGCKRVAIDIETCDPTLRDLGPGPRRGGYICGVSFALEDGPVHYLPIRHSEDNLDRGHVWAYLSEQSKCFTGEIVGANCQYDWDYLNEWSIFFNDCKFRDVQVIESLLNEFRPSYALEALAKYYKLTGKDESLLRECARLYGIDAKQDLHKLPGRYVANYAIADVRLPLEIYKRQIPLLEAHGLTAVSERENALLPVLLRMRRRGVRVDLARLLEIELKVNASIREEISKLRTLAGVTLSPEDFDASAAVAKVLRQVPGINIPLTPKTKKPSVDNAFLESIDHPIARCMESARKWRKRLQFVASVREHHVNGRIHPCFHQSKSAAHWAEDEDGAAHGRLSCTDPNLQQQPGKGEFGPIWRSIYVPDEGCQWASIDYANQEPRIYTHFADTIGATGAAEMVAKWNADPTMSLHAEVAHMCHIVEGQAKTINLGVAYGMGGGKLCRKLKLPTEWAVIHGVRREVAGPDGRRLLAAYDRGFPYLRKLAKFCSKLAEDRGYVKTILGRRCRFECVDGRYIETHKALNRVVQGSAGDQTKLALIECDKAGIPVQLQVHDEICLSVKDRAGAEAVAEIMQNCVPLRVPVVTDIALGDSWGSSMEK